MKLTQGREIGGRYRIHEVLGEGGVATVYSASHLLLGSEHAIKVLRKPSAAQRARLVMEGRVQATIRHAHILRVTDIVDLGEDLGLVMDLVRGPNLATWMRQQQPRVSLEEARQLGCAILAGVAAAHEAGLVHRDLKPDNVLLQVEDGGLVPRIADFGLVRALDDDGQHTREGMAMGTPSYMAPEQWRDAATVDQRADVFAVAATLYELVSGRKAVPGASPQEVFARLASHEVEPLSAVRPEVPESWSAAIRWALTYDRDRRMPDVGPLLEAWSGGTVAPAQVPTTMELPSPVEPAEPSAPMWYGVALIAVAALLAAAVLWPSPPLELRVHAQGGAADDATLTEPFAVSSGDQLVTGQHVRLVVEVSRTAYVYAVDGTSGQLVYPGDGAMKVAAGRPHALPVFKLTDGPTREEVVVVASDAQLSAEEVLGTRPRNDALVAMTDGPTRGLQVLGGAPTAMMAVGQTQAAVSFRWSHRP